MASWSVGLGRTAHCPITGAPVPAFVHARHLRRAIVRTSCSHDDGINASTSACSGMDEAVTSRLVQRICQTTAASALVLTLMSCRGAAQAREVVWKPRRHHRRMGERVLDTWAEDMVEVQETEKQQARSAKQRAEALRRQQAEEARLRKIADDEALRKRAQQLLSQQASEARKPILSLRVGSVDVAPYLVWGGIALMLFLTYKSRILSRLFPGVGRSAGGRWVYDRSLGGKKVWVPEGTAAPEGSSEIPRRGPLAEREFDRLASLAASASAGAAADSTAAGTSTSLPDWWDSPPVLYATESQKAEAQEEAERIVRRLERLKNVGQDYPPEEILMLRRVCQEGCVSVEPKTKGGRDAIFATAVEVAVQAAMDPNGSAAAGMLAGSSPVRLVCGTAMDVRVAERSAALTVMQAVAKAARLRLVDAVMSLRAGQEVDAALALVRLTNLLRRLPVLQPRAQEVALLAGSLQDTSTVEERQQIFLLAGELLPEQAPVLASMLGFEPDMVVPQLGRMPTILDGGVQRRPPP